MSNYYVRCRECGTITIAFGYEKFCENCGSDELVPCDEKGNISSSTSGKEK